MKPFNTSATTSTAPTSPRGRTVRTAAAVAVSIGLLLSGTPASAASRLSCVKTWSSFEFPINRAYAQNNCAGTIKTNFVITKDSDSGWREAAKGETASWGYHAFGASLDKVLVKYKGRTYVHEH